MNKIIIFILSIVLPGAFAQLNLTFEMDELQFTREAIGEAQWWHFIGGNSVHSDWHQFVMNIIAFGTICSVSKRFKSQNLSGSTITVCLLV